MFLALVCYAAFAAAVQATSGSGSGSGFLEAVDGEVFSPPSLAADAAVMSSPSVSLRNRSLFSLRRAASTRRRTTVAAVVAISTLALTLLVLKCFHIVYGSYKVHRSLAAGGPGATPPCGRRILQRQRTSSGLTLEEAIHSLSRQLRALNLAVGDSSAFLEDERNDIRTARLHLGAVLAVLEEKQKNPAEDPHKNTFDMAYRWGWTVEQEGQALLLLAKAHREREMTARGATAVAAARRVMSDGGCQLVELTEEQLRRISQRSVEYIRKMVGTFWELDKEGVKKVQASEGVAVEGLRLGQLVKHAGMDELAAKMDEEAMRLFALARHVREKGAYPKPTPPTSIYSEPERVSPSQLDPGAGPSTSQQAAGYLSGPSGPTSPTPSSTMQRTNSLHALLPLATVDAQPPAVTHQLTRPRSFRILKVEQGPITFSGDQVRVTKSAPSSPLMQRREAFTQSLPRTIGGPPALPKKQTAPPKPPRKSTFRGAAAATAAGAGAAAATAADAGAAAATAAGTGAAAATAAGAGAAAATAAGAASATAAGAASATAAGAASATAAGAAAAAAAGAGAEAQPSTSPEGASSAPVVLFEGTEQQLNDRVRNALPQVHRTADKLEKCIVDHQSGTLRSMFMARAAKAMVPAYKIVAGFSDTERHPMLTPANSRALKEAVERCAKVLERAGPLFYPDWTATLQEQKHTLVESGNSLNVVVMKMSASTDFSPDAPILQLMTNFSARLVKAKQALSAVQGLIDGGYAPDAFQAAARELELVTGGSDIELTMTIQKFARQLTEALREKTEQVREMQEEQARLGGAKRLDVDTQVRNRLLTQAFKKIHQDAASTHRMLANLRGGLSELLDLKKAIDEAEKAASMLTQ